MNVVVSHDVLSQVRLAFELLPAVLAIVEAVLGARFGKSGAGSVPVAGRLLRLLAFVGRGRLTALRVGARRVLLLGFVPAPVRRQIRRAAEELVAFGAPVLDADDSGAFVLSQREGIRVRLSAQLTDELAQRLVAGCRLRSGFLLHRTLFDLQAQHWRGGHLVFKLQFSHGFGFLGCRFAFALAIRRGSFGGYWDRVAGTGSVAVAGAYF